MGSAPIRILVLVLVYDTVGAALWYLGHAPRARLHLFREPLQLGHGNYEPPGKLAVRRR
jgi:hypothetical protein